MTAYCILPDLISRFILLYLALSRFTYSKADNVSAPHLLIIALLGLGCYRRVYLPVQLVLIL